MSKSKLLIQFEDAKILVFSLTDTMGAHYKRSSTDGKLTGFVAINTRKLRFIINTDEPNVIDRPEANLKWKDGRSYPARKIITINTKL